MSRKSTWERLLDGEVVDEKRIEKIKRPPKGLSGPYWKEEMKKVNHNNIYQELKRRGYRDVILTRKWDSLNERYFSYLRIEGVDLLLWVDGEQVPIWKLATIEKFLHHRKRKEEKMRARIQKGLERAVLRKGLNGYPGEDAGILGYKAGAQLA